MRIVTFNVQHARTPAGPVAAELLAGYCAELGADVLGLQEVDVGLRRSGRVDQASAAAKPSGMSAAFATARRMGVGGFGGRYGNALLVRGTLGEVATLALPRAGRAERRAALLASLVIGGRRISAAVTHLSVDRQEALSQLEAVVTALRARPEPRLLLGDLNLRPEVAGPVLAGNGFSVADLTDPTYPAGGPFLRIDHVAVQGLELGAVTVLPPAPVSDHRALLVEVA